jgi:hypothetical protein
MSEAKRKLLGLFRSRSTAPTPSKDSRNVEYPLFNVIVLV